MYRLIIEHIIRHILQEEEFTNLQITSFRDRPARIDTFLSKIGTDSEFTLKNGDTITFTDAKIVKNNPVKGLEDKELQKEFTFLKDSGKFG